MEFKFHNNSKGQIAELISDSKLNTVDDFVDLLGNASFQGAENIIIRGEHLDDKFFDLKTRIAGEVLQKFSNYRVRLAIVGSYENVQSKSLNDFIRESNRTGHILFVSSVEEAIAKLN